MLSGARKKKPRLQQSRPRSTRNRPTRNNAVLRTTSAKPTSNTVTPKRNRAMAAARAARTAAAAAAVKQADQCLFQSVWRRKFRPLPEAKAVDLFADVIGDTFILTVAGGLIVYEYWKASQKPDTNKERFDDLNRRFDELKKKEDDLIAAEDEQRKRFESLEEVLRALRDPKTKEPLVAALQST